MMDTLNTRINALDPIIIFYSFLDFIRRGINTGNQGAQKPKLTGSPRSTLMPG